MSSTAGTPPLFEFIVPTIGLEHLDADLISQYACHLEQGWHPTAVALSVFESKGAGHGLKDLYYHTHYLIDGHHKVTAAAQIGKPITLLSFLAWDDGSAGVASLCPTIQKT